VTWVNNFTLDLVSPPPPPPPPPPPAPWYICSLSTLGTCVEAPAGAPGAVAALADCEEACAPVWVCAGAAGCVEAPAQTVNSWPTPAQCEAACIECDLTGLWWGTTKGVQVRISQEPINASAASATVWTVPDVWGSNATGYVLPGLLSVTGGWCKGGTCDGAVSALEAGGPNCAKVTWGAGEFWCSPELEPVRCSGAQV
jgi:hypothetical protein